MATPKTIPEYLDQLRAALADADPALVQDALYDAEEYLRSELAANPRVSEADMLARIASSYGAPEEVADIYRVQEATVTQALRPPPPPPRSSPWGKFFGVAAEPRTYGALLYMLFAMPLGIFYFTWAVTGISLSLGLSILIIGIPFAVLFMGTVYALSLVEGRLVEGLLGERMPRRPQYDAREGGFFARIKTILTDPRSWATLLYMLLMLPLGILYFTVAVTMISTSLGLMFAPIAWLLGLPYGISVDGEHWVPVGLSAPLSCALGVVLFFLTLHLARVVGRFHAGLAKHLLVKNEA